MKSKNSIILLFPILMFITSNASAQLSCIDLFKSPSTIRFNQVEKSILKNAIKEFKVNSIVFRALLNKIPERQRKNIEHIINSTEFFDYKDTAGTFLDNFLNYKRNQFDFSAKYADEGFLNLNKTQAFDGFLAAKKLLIENKPELNIDLLKNIQILAMSNGVEGVSKNQLGQLRDMHWIGGVDESIALTKAELIEIEKNPYLYFEMSQQISDQLKSKAWTDIKFWGKDKNTKSYDRGHLYTGKISYPNILKSKKDTIDLIKISHPNLYAQINKIRLNQANQTESYDYSNPLILNLERQFTEALVVNRIAEFKVSANQLGEVKIGQNEKEYIHMVADLQRDIVAIHPLNNGNGRSTRLMMNYLLNRVGLPSSRIVDPFKDIQFSKNEWRDAVYNGVVSSAKLIADFKIRLQNGMTIEYSPELIFPGLPEKIEIMFKKQGSDKVYLGSHKVDVNSHQFIEFLKVILNANPELKQELVVNRVESMNRIAELFLQFYKSKTIEYEHEKDGRSVIKLSFVESDFSDSFAVVRAPYSPLWKNKLNRWYDQNQFIWRGLSSKTGISETEILNYFMKPNSHLASNAVLNKQSQGIDLKKAMLSDFEQYNIELLNGKLIEMANDHHKTGPRYGSSYGYSTSKREVVGKAFAMGAMVIADYGKQNDPELQKQLKARINIASYRAAKDIDLGRLKPFESEFSYIYGRQAEVMAIGGTDPDAIMLVQSIDSLGEIEKTYYRNINKPNEIFIIKGRYVPEMGLLDPKTIISKFVINFDQQGKLTLNQSHTIESKQFISAQNKVTPQLIKEEQSVVNTAGQTAKDLFYKFLDLF